MAKERYRYINFSDKKLDFIETIARVAAEYQEQGFVLTVRQLYYQLVARDIIPNTMRSYKNTASAINDARITGLLDWDIIEDRLRSFVRKTRWKNGQEILEAAARSYHIDMWKLQPRRVFVIIEKDALSGVLKPTCESFDVPLLAARGYPSVSVLREFAIEDILPTIDEQEITVLHFGDHDPSGIDMTRDLTERISLFCRQPVEVVRLALTMDQVEERKPPPNPAKPTDSRYEAYREEFGDESWELDALPPSFLVELVTREIEARIEDEGQWDADRRKVKDVQERIRKAAKGFA